MDPIDDEYEYDEIDEGAWGGEVDDEYEKQDEDEYEEYDAEQVQIANTAIIPIQGIIGKHLSLLEMSCGCVDVDDIGLQLDRAIADESVDSIILYFDTAGGTVTGIPELAGVVM